MVQFIFSLFAVLLSFDAITRERETTRADDPGQPARQVGTRDRQAGRRLCHARDSLLISFLAGSGPGGRRAGCISPRIPRPCGLDAGGFPPVHSRVLPARTAGLIPRNLLVFRAGHLSRFLAGRCHGAAAIRIAGGATLETREIESGAWLEKAAAENGIEMEKGRALEEESRKSWLTDKEGRKVPGEDWDRRRSEIVTPFEERSAQALRRIEEDFRRRKSEQRSLDCPWPGCRLPAHSRALPQICREPAR